MESQHFALEQTRLVQSRPRFELVQAWHGVAARSSASVSQ